MAKINWGRKVVYLCNAAIHGVRPKLYTCRFMKEGLTNYPDADGKDKTWLLPRAVMDEMQESFVGCPVIAKHNVNSTAEDFQKKVEAGEYDGIVSKCWTDNDGWDCSEFLVWNPEVIDKIENQGWTVSCAYTTEGFIGGGTYNAIPFDHEVTKANYIHMAIVDSPRQTGAQIMLNSIDTEKVKCIIFNMNGLNYKLFPKGRTVMKNDIKSVVDKLIKEKKLDPTRSHGEAKEALEKAGITSDDEITKGIDYMIKAHYNHNNVAPEGWEDVVKALKTQPGVENPWATAWAMKEKGYQHNAIDKSEEYPTEKDANDEMRKKGGTQEGWFVTVDEGSKKAMLRHLKKNEGGKVMFKCAKCSKEYESEDEMKKCACSEGEGIDVENAVIETPDGDVKLKDLITSHQSEQKDIAEKERLEKESKGAKKTLTMDDEIEIDGKRHKVSELLDAHKRFTSKKNADDEAAAKKPKDEEEAEAAEAAKTKKSEDRKAALKSEGKSDEEAEDIIKREEEEGLAAENSVKLNAAKAELDKMTTNFNELAKAFANSKGPEAKAPAEYVTKNEKIEAIKKSKQY